MRIVSLLPSATEIVCSIGLRDQLVGVTHECDFPASVGGLPIVTRSLIPEGLSSAAIDAQVRQRLREHNALYRLREDVLEELRPDLIVTQALCDVCAVAADEVEAAACALPGRPRVVNLEPSSLQEVFETVEWVGDAAGQAGKARRAVAEMRARLDAVRQRSAALPSRDRPRVAVLEWLHPPFNAGHWTPQLVEFAGGIDCLGNPFEPSTTVSWERVAASDPDAILVALCGFGEERSLEDVELLREEPGWKSLRAVREGRAYLTDGNAYFNRPGPRLLDSLEILAHALHPRVHPAPPEAPPARHVG
ncbi:MAG: cobalamin-binding protein [Proteobacteria bacterium]|nr:cobalamin-binding protein [Pseudomonadota bacterium]